MNLFHRTTRDHAEAILREGFRDNTDRYMTQDEYTGVWLSNVPLDENEGAAGDILLRVILDLPEADLRQYEWVEELKSYREFLIPAAIVNTGRVEIVEDRGESEGLGFSLP